MASTYSALKIELIGTGEQAGTWGSTTNVNLGTALEEAIVGRATANFPANSDLTLTLTNSNTSQVARNYILNVVSSVALTTTRNLIVPTISKPYIIENNTTGGQSILVKTAAGTGITVANGDRIPLYVDGTNVVNFAAGAAGILATANGGTGASSLTGAGIVTTGDAQTITGAKTVTGAFGVTDANPLPNIWPAYFRNKLDANPSIVMDGGTGSQPITSAFLGGGGATVEFCFFAYGSPSSFSKVGAISSTGSSTNYGTSSDYRLKTNVKPMTGALATVAQLKPVTYTWISTGLAGEGFIADQLQKVIPDAVVGVKDGVYPDGKPRYQEVDTSFVVATLTCAIQEQQTLINDLTARVAALETV